VKGAVLQKTNDLLKSVPFTQFICCDSCTARSKFQVILENGDLYFCSHHLNKFRSHLEALGIQFMSVNNQEKEENEK
jgi:hypothetical protein